MSATATTVEKGKLWGGGTSPFGVSYGKMMMWFFLISDALTFTGLLTAYGFMRHKFTDIWPVAGDVFTHFPFYDGHVELAYVALMTFILIMSSVTMVLAVEAGHRMDKKKVVLWLSLTVVGGFIFLGSQAYEWYHFIHGTEAGAYQLADKSIVHVVDAEGHRVKDLADGVGVMFPNKEVVQGAEASALLTNAEWFQGANMTRNEYGHPLFGDFFFFITGFHGFHVFSGVIINLVVLIMVMLNVFAKTGHYEMVEKVGLYWHFVDLVWVFVFTFFYLL